MLGVNAVTIIQPIPAHGQETHAIKESDTAASGGLHYSFFKPIQVSEKFLGQTRFGFLHNPTWNVAIIGLRNPSCNAGNDVAIASD